MQIFGGLFIMKPLFFLFGAIKKTRLPSQVYAAGTFTDNYRFRFLGSSMYSV